jgi:8-oxo-dGTP pyrophosphatase MutT (NUDIX family)
LATCIRETREECGLELSPYDLRRELPPTTAGNALGSRRHEAASRLSQPVHVAPFLFEIAPGAPPRLRLDPLECAAAHWAPESYLRDPAARAFITPLPDAEKRFPSILFEGGHIWGFTYKVLEELLKL